jgi:hypothetical protein
MYCNYPFSIHFAVLDPNLIYNYCGPKTQQYIDTLNAENGFYIKLEESVKRTGLRNPILVTSGYQGCPNIKVNRIPSELRNDLQKIIVCDRNGGSRLWVAQRLGLSIPCIISDWTERFSHEKELFSIPDIMKCYTDTPDEIIVNDHGVHIRSLPQIHLNQRPNVTVNCRPQVSQCTK